MKYQDWN